MTMLMQMPEHSVAESEDEAGQRCDFRRRVEFAGRLAPGASLSDDDVFGTDVDLAEVMSLYMTGSAASELPTASAFQELVRTLETASQQVIAFDEDPLESSPHVLKEMLSWSENWDGHGSAQPSKEAILDAARWIGRFNGIAVATRHPIPKPHISADEEGAVVFEWWGGGRKLTLYFTGERVEFVRVWGPDMDNEMQEGTVTRPERAVAMLQWLVRA